MKDAGLTHGAFYGYFPSKEALIAEAVRHALPPVCTFTDDDGRTIHQIGKTGGNEAIELLARDFQALPDRPAEVEQAVQAILDAADKGRAGELGRLLDEHLDLIDARGDNFLG